MSALNALVTPYTVIRIYQNVKNSVIRSIVIIKRETPKYNILEIVKIEPYLLNKEKTYVFA